MGKRSILILRWLTMLIAVFFGGLFLGWMLGYKKQKNIPTDVTIEKVMKDKFGLAMDRKEIAVVNMDAGVFIDGVQTYFSQSMLSFPDEDFLMTGIEDARRGMSSGKYASYIVVPATFSESIESINKTPSRVVLDYQISSGLDGNTKAEIVERIADFSAGLNENITYTYVSSIFKEFHTAQDNTLTVMKNNQNTHLRLSDVNPQNLLDRVEVPDKIFVELIPVDSDYVEEFYKVNIEVAEKIKDDVANTLTKQMEQYTNIRGSRDILSDEVQFFLSQVEDIDVLRDEDGNLVHQYGMEQLHEIARRYDEEEQLRHETIRMELENRAVLNQEILNTRLEQIQLASEQRMDAEIIRIKTEVQNYLDIELIRIQEGNADAVRDNLMDIRNELERILATPSNATPSNAIQNDDVEIDSTDLNLFSNNMVSVENAWINATPSDATPSNATPSDAILINEMRGNVNSLLEHVIQLIQRGILKSAVEADAADRDEETQIWLEILPPLFTLEHPNRESITLFETAQDQQMITRIDELFEVPIEDIRHSMQTNVLNVMEAKWEKDSRRLQSDMKSLFRKAEEYYESFEKIVALSESDSNISDKYLSESKNGVRQAQNSLEKSVREYEKQVYDIERISNENIDNYETAIQTSNKNTEDALEDVFKTLVTESEKSNKENTGLLNEFSTQLLYSRNGSLPNKATYQQISAPVAPMRITDKIDVVEKKAIHAYEVPNWMAWICFGSLMIFLITLIEKRVKLNSTASRERGKTKKEDKKRHSTRDI